MSHTLNRAFMAVGIVVCVFIGTATSSSTSMDQPAGQEGTLDPKSNALALVYGAFRDSGYDAHQAIALAHQSMGKPYPQFTPDENSTQGSLDPNSNALAIVYGLFRDSGWPPEKAITIARAALGLEDATTCGAYRVYVTYCSGGVEKQGVFWMNSRCYEDPDGDPHTADGLNVCDTLACLPGTYRWLSLTTVGTGGGCSALPASTCIQLRVETPSIPVDCTEIEIECACFVETTPTVNCAAIEQCCCSSPSMGCSGCPSRTPPCAPQ